MKGTNSHVLMMITTGSIESVAIRDMLLVHATNYKHMETNDMMRCASVIFSRSLKFYVIFFEGILQKSKHVTTDCQSNNKETAILLARAAEQSCTKH